MRQVLDRPEIDCLEPRDAVWSAPELDRLAAALTRRKIVLSGGALAALGQRGGRAQTPAATPAGAWSFTDDRGYTVGLPHPPKRIIAQVGVGSALRDLGVPLVGVFGSLRRADGSPEAVAGAIDLDAVVDVGSGVFGELDLEKIVSLEPDLVIGITFGLDYPDSMWWVNDDVYPLLNEIAPTIVVNTADEPVTGPISRFEALAEALGSQLDTPEHAVARASFDEVSQAVVDALAAKPDLLAIALGADADGIYVANPVKAADLNYFQQLGLNLVQPELEEPSFYWESLSWEQANKYQTDLILNDARFGSYSIDQISAQPTFADLPAARAGQMADWQAEYVISYQGFTRILTDLATAIRRSRDDVV